MSYYKNIIPGQCQLGDIVFGRGTNIIIDHIDVKPYDLNVQDYQRTRSDENNFGQDFKKPTTIEFGLNLLYNEMREEFAHLKPNFWHNEPDLDDLAREWGFDEGRKIWGTMKPLYMCGRDQIPKIVFGRPNQFGGEYPYRKAELVPILADFRRADTLGYGVQEHGIAFSTGTLTGTIPGTLGTVPSWIRILVKGPIDDLTLQFSELFETPEPFIFHLGYDVPAGEVVEISSYPWERRAVSSTGENVSAYLDAATPYLDRLRINHDTDCTINVTGDNKTADTSVLVLYRDAYRTL